jgi:uncharacterized membrane protein
VRERVWEVDVLRGIAVVAMVLYHFSYDLAYFVGLFDVELFRSGAGLDAARAIGGTFIFLAGLSLTLSYRRALAAAQGRKLFGKYLMRGVRIFSYGLIITFLTWIFVPREMIIFGILHLIGVSIILAYPFLGLKFPNVALGFGCITLGLYLSDFSTNHPWLTALGVRPNFGMLAYWPIFPWFGVALLGVFAGNVFYGDEGKRTPPASPHPSWSWALAFLGRRSLVIYLTHQPVLISALVLLGLADLRIS